MRLAEEHWFGCVFRGTGGNMNRRYLIKAEGHINNIFITTNDSQNFKQSMVNECWAYNVCSCL